MFLLFPSESFSPTKPDPDFIDQMEAAAQAGFETALVDIDEMTARLRGLRGPAVYRGWMMSPERYVDFEDMLKKHDVSLIVDSTQYKYCHHLPQWYPEFAGSTPRSIWFEGQGQFELDRLSKEFGSRPIILKDYVKSAKHYWHEACFIPAADDLDRVKAVVERFCELRDGRPEGGLVFREFIDFQAIGAHHKSGMPLTLEYRIFFWHRELLISHRYWEEADYPETVPPMEELARLAKSVQSPFFTMDVACDQEGKWWVVELGDGQVAGLPPDLDAGLFYGRWAELALSH